jgi:hypothetical protein
MRVRQIQECRCCQQKTCGTPISRKGHVKLEISRIVKLFTLFDFLKIERVSRRIN